MLEQTNYSVSTPVTNDKAGAKKKESTIKHLKGIRPTAAFIGASWAALGIGLISYCIGLWNADMMLNEKGYYFTLILFGLFSGISVQKCVRDKSEGIPVTDIYYGISWFTTLAAIVLLVIGLRNADITLSEKGFYGMSFTLALFAAIAVQKNTRDTKLIDSEKE
ncbi:MAG: inner membrane protein YiaA [Crocinitomicaceae bacterium]